MDKGIKFILAPMSRRSFPTDTSLMEHGIVTFPGSLSLCGSFLWITTLQLPSTTMFSLLTYFPLRKSFMNLVYKGICCKASLKGMVISSLLKMSRKRAKHCSLSFLDGTKGYGVFFTGTEGVSFLLASRANWLLVLLLSFSPFFFSFLLPHHAHPPQFFFLLSTFPPSENYLALLFGSIKYFILSPFVEAEISQGKRCQV